MIRPSTDLGAHITAAPAGGSSTAGAPVLIVAAAATDNVKRTGKTIDRAAYGMPDSGVLNIAGLFTLAQDATVKFAAEILESSDGSNWDAAEALFAATTVGTGGAGGSNESVLKQHDLVLRGRKRYFRVDITCDLSAGGVDTGHYDALVVLGGQAVLPIA